MFLTGNVISVVQGIKDVETIVVHSHSKKGASLPLLFLSFNCRGLMGLVVGVG